jgi:hypothetical protein
MGKQGLKALQALGTDASGNSLAVPKPALVAPPRRSTNLTPYASDNSSLTPSQSASQTASRSVETSHEGPTSKEHEHVQPAAEPENTSRHQAQSSRTNDDGDLTITVPPAHAISELAFPTGVRTTQSRPLENGNGDPSTTSNTPPASAQEQALRRKRSKHSRRPPSHPITEVSDEGSNEPNASASDHVNSRVPHTPFPTTATHDTSSDEDEHPVGPLQIVENDPFEVIRRSMLGAAPASPVAHASAPDVRASIMVESSPSKAPLRGSSLSISRSAQGQSAGMAVGQSPPKRQRKTSAFFGSLRGLFRKPRERDRVVTEWDEGPSSPSPSSPNRGRVRRTGWVTRTDARIKSRAGQQDSDEEVMERTTPKVTATGMTTNVVRAPSGARLRKGRPGASANENGPSRAPSHRASVDGWITDAQGSLNAGMDTIGADASLGRSRTRRGTVKRKRISVADLRGSEQGHTVGEVDGGGRSMEPVSSKGRGRALDAEGSVSRRKPVVEDERQTTAPTDANRTADPNLTAGTNIDPHAGPGPAQRRATTTVTSSRRLSSDAAPAHRRSASLSVVDAHVMVVSTSASTSTQTTSTAGSMSWRKPPPQIDSQPASPSAAPSQSQSSVRAQAQASAPSSSSRAHESQSKQNARRHLGNGHAKHVQNQSLMSIVADVTQERVARSMDLPRAPGSILCEDCRGVGMETEVNGRGHARTTSSPQDGGRGQGQRAVKLPLRSALRNASRTPSPSPAIVPVSGVKKEGLAEERGRVAVSPSLRDSASISSYETGRESLDGEAPSPTLPPQSRSPPVRSQSQHHAAPSASPVLRAQTRTPSPPPLSFTFPPPPVDPPPVRSGTTASNTNANGSANANEPGSSNASTETPPVRRKSVRVSLQPTFSPTPPADEDGERYAPWSEGERNASGDVWADSSEEDEMYSHARRLLSSGKR